MPEYILLPVWLFAPSLVVIIVITTLALLFRWRRIRSRRKSHMQAERRSRFQEERELEYKLAQLSKSTSELKDISARLDFITSALFAINNESCEPEICIRLSELSEASEMLSGYQDKFDQNIRELYQHARENFEGVNDAASEKDRIAGNTISVKPAIDRPKISKEAFEAVQSVSTHVM